MKKISYITNIKLTETSGGMSGINNATYNQLIKYFNIINYSYINPKVSKPETITSKFQKLLKLKRNYFFFSEKQLSIIRNKFKKEEETDAYFFFGFTPWIKIKPNKPYYCYNDACFATYIDIYNNKNEFKQSEINRIFKQEAIWLRNAKKVFFLSQWAAEQTKKHYNLSGNNFENVKLGGFIDIPEKDIYQDGYDFLFLSREFIPKGGLVAVKAVEKLKQKYPNITLSIVGEKPPEEVTKIVGINYLGFFDKENPDELKKLKKIFALSFALIHPTIKDTNTLVITELAYFGVPAISSNKFAIPEYLSDKKTGYLLDDPKDHNELAEKMELLITNRADYLQMRINSRKNAIENNTWDKVGESIEQLIKMNI